MNTEKGYYIFRNDCFYRDLFLLISHVNKGDRNRDFTSGFKVLIWIKIKIFVGDKYILCDIQK